MRKKRGTPFDLDYFLSRSQPEPNTGCWFWMGAVRWSGYGAVRIAGKTANAHRAVYEIVTGRELARDIDVCHRCDVRCCVNPDHLFAGSRADNMRDCWDKHRIVLPGLRGEDCPASKLSSDEVRAIRADIVTSSRALARKFNVDKGTISGIRKRLTWRHI